MVTKAELMASGMPGSLASKLGQDAVGAVLTATGNAQGNALLIAGTASIFGTVAASTGAILPSAHAKSPYLIVNNGANALTVYPAVGESINGGAANASFSIPAGKSATFYASNNQWFANASA